MPENTNNNFDNNPNNGGITVPVINTPGSVSDVSNNQLNSMSEIRSAPVDNKKKVIIVIAILIVLTVLGLTAYLLMNNKSVVVDTSTPTDNINFPDLSNKNNNEFYTENGENVNSGIMDAEGESEVSPLVHLWTKPVLTFAMKTVTSSDGATKSGVYYMLDKETGNIYMASDISEKKYETVRMSVTEIREISSAVFDNSITRLYYIKNGGLYTASVPLSANSELSLSEALDTKVLNVYNNRFDNTIIYTKTDNGGLNMYKFDPAKSTVSKLGFLPLSNVRLDWIDKNTIRVYTGATENTAQNILSYNIGTAKLSTEAVSAGSNLLYQSDLISSSYGQLTYKSLINGVSNNIEYRSYADKCVFVAIKKIICASPNQMFNPQIDLWYMGATHYADSLYLTDLVSGTSNNFFDHSLVSGQSIDTFNPLYSDNNLLFQNKTDESLWLMKLGGLLNDTLNQ